MEGKEVTNVYQLKPRQSIKINVRSATPKRIGFKDIKSLEAGKEVPQDEFAIKIERPRKRGEKGTFALMSSKGAFFLSVNPNNGRIVVKLKNLTDIPLQATVFVDEPF